MTVRADDARRSALDLHDEVGHGGISLDDVHALVHGIATASSASADPADRADRLLGLVLDGLRARPGGTGMMEP
jgi:hypothetical protein